MADALTDQAIALVDSVSPPPDASPPAKWGSVSRNPKRIRTMLALHDEGKTTHAIAAIVGISQAEVSRTLNEWMPVNELAKLKIDSAQLTAVESLIRAFPAAEKKGLDGPQSKILEAGGLLRAHERAGTVIVQIGAGSADVNIGVISAPSLVPRNEIEP